jgi:D-alanyl-D-alanine carboxypeptidase
LGGFPGSIAHIRAPAFTAAFSVAAIGKDAPAPLVDQLDSLAVKAYPADGPGASVIVVNKGQILLRKGYGLADRELGVPVDPADTFRLGSILVQY